MDGVSNALQTRPSDPRDSGNGLSQALRLAAAIRGPPYAIPHITAAVRKRLHPADVEPAPVSTASDSRWRGVDGSAEAGLPGRTLLLRPPPWRVTWVGLLRPSPLPPALSRAPAAGSSRGSLGEPPRVALSAPAPQVLKFGLMRGAGQRCSGGGRSGKQEGAAAAAAVARMGSAADASLTRSHSSSSVASTAAPLVSTLAHELQVRAPVHV